MKRTIASILIAVMMLIGCCACGSDHRDKIVFPEDELLAGYTFEGSADMEQTAERNGALFVNFHRGEMNISGQIFVPEGDGPFPAVVISGGLFTTQYRYLNIARSFADNGIVSIIYDPTCMGEGSQSDGGMLDFSALTEAADVEAIVSQAARLPYVDGNNIFLWGHSMGGLVSGYVGFSNQDLIRGLILIEPSFQMNEEARELFPDIDSVPDVVRTPFYIGGAYYRDLLRFDIYDNMPRYKRSVLMYAGTVSPSIGSDRPEVLTRACELLPSCELVYADGANHGFEGDAMAMVIEGSVAFIKENMKTSIFG